MKKIITTFVILIMMKTVNAGSINPAVYHTMTSTSYRNNYNRQINYRPIPYWQAQSNYITRNRFYQNYANYNNSMYQHYSSVKSNRSFR